MKTRWYNSSGFALITTMFLIVLFGALFGAYSLFTQTEIELVKSSKFSQSGFNAAEAGLNLRAEEIRGIFDGYEEPVGTSPASIAACDVGTSIGTGDYLCKSYSLSNGHSAVTYVVEEPGNPIQRTIPAGEPFAGLSTQEWRYTVTSVGRNKDSSNEAILDLTFQSRAVPLFQFAIFFEEDLEIFNGATMSLDGPLHTNGDLYISPQDGGTSQFVGPVSTAGTFYRGQKSQSTCSGYGGTGRISSNGNPASPSYVNMPNCSSSRSVISNVSSWNNNVNLAIDRVSVPDVSNLTSFSDGDYWQLADLRLVLRLNSSGNPVTTNAPTGVEVVGTNGVTDTSATTSLHHSTCTGLISQGASTYSVGTRGPSDSSKLRLYREYQSNSTMNNYQRTFEVDMRALLNCIHRFPAIMGSRGLNDTTQKGLVFFFAIDGPNSAVSQNNYSVRLRNGAALQSNVSGAATVEGLTVVTDQGLVVWGNYNTTGWIPAALIGDTLWLLSNSWVDADSTLTDAYDRDGNATSVNAAVLSGIKRTGNANGTPGQDHGADSNGGGAINVFRFNEWFRSGSGTPDFTYVGSIASLGQPQKSNSTWGPFTYYSAPNRVWSYDERFNDPDNLPPMTPVFVYLRQELFVRDYDLN